MAFGARDMHRDSYLPLDRYRLRNLNDLKPFRSTESLKRDSTYLPERSAAVGRRDHKSILRLKNVPAAARRACRDAARRTVGGMSMHLISGLGRGRTDSSRRGPSSAMNRRIHPVGTP